MQLLVALALASFANAFTLFSPTNPGMHGWHGSGVRFNINSSGCPSTTVNFGALIVQAFDVWNGVPSANLTLSRGNDSTTSPSVGLGGTALDSPVIICDNSFSTNTGANRDLVSGITTLRVDNGDNYISYVSVDLNTEGGTGSLTNMTTDQKVVVIAHELGHAIGLGNSSDPKALMYYDTASKSQASLSQDDMDGVTYLYPRSEPAAGTLMGCGTISNPSNRLPPLSGLFSLVLFFSICWLLLRALRYPN